MSYIGHSLGGGNPTPLQGTNRCILQPQLTGPSDTRWGSLTPLQRSSRCILQPLPHPSRLGKHFEQIFCAILSPVFVFLKKINWYFFNHTRSFVLQASIIYSASKDITLSRHGIRKYNYLPLAVEWGQSALFLELAPTLTPFQNVITCSNDWQTDNTIWNRSNSRWTLVDKSGRKAIKFATLVLFKYMFVFLYCFEFFFIRIESLTIKVGWGPAKKNILAGNLVLSKMID